ncbi:MAG TPA: DMT family transporter [Candidatus Saccharimonadales bacterium]|nr:DMT family transporter [Candidatus Saccharimonadales bacterium]
MNFLFPLATIVSWSIATILDKLNYTRNRIAPKQLMLIVFTGMSLSLALYIVITHKPFPNFSPVALGLLGLIGLISFLGNVFDYFSLKANDLPLREPIVDFEPIWAGLVGYAFLPSERKPAYLVIFALGALILYIGMHRIKLRRLQKEGVWYLLLSTFFYGLLPVIYKHALNYLSPEYISLFRVVAILLLCSIFLHGKKSRSHSLSKVTYGLSSGAIAAVGAVANLYAIQYLGVVVTMLFLATGPALRYLASYFILSEKVRRVEVMSSFLLIAVVLVGVAI